MIAASGRRAPTSTKAQREDRDLRKTFVAKTYRDDVLERVRNRHQRAVLRRGAREVATAMVAKGLDDLLAAGPPAHFDGEQARAFASILRNHKDRMIGRVAPAAASKTCSPGPNAPSANYDECNWDQRFSKEDFAELRRQGYGVADWRLA